MNAAETALRSILSDVRSAWWHKQNKGGQQCGGPPILWSLPPSALIHLERTCCHGLGVSNEQGNIAEQLRIYDEVTE
jgi:hypothetical protein